MNTPVDPKAAEAGANQVPAVIPARRQEIRVVTDPIAVLDTARFEQMQRVANVMAASSYLPDALCKTKGKDDTGRDVMLFLPDREIISNCFMVVNQAVRWGMDPFAVAQCVSVVHGKLCYEGKLIAGLIDAKLSIRLRYEWSGAGEAMKIKVSGTFQDGATESIEGSVSEWKTTRAGSPWTPQQYRKMLAYRGSREWARLYAPGLMLGVYSPDEMDALSDDSRSSRARDVPPQRSADDDDGPPVPQIPQRQAAPLAPDAPQEPTTDASYVDLVESGRDDGRQEIWDGESGDEPPTPSRQPGQSRPNPTASTGPSPAASSSSPTTPAAGEVFLSKAQLLAAIEQGFATFKDSEDWIEGFGKDIGELNGPDQREVEKAFNAKTAKLKK